MTITTYTCDRCKKPTLREELFRLSLKLTGGGYNSTHNSDINDVEWCRDCCCESGLVKWSNTTIIPPVNPPTFEELITEIIATKIQELQQTL